MCERQNERHRKCVAPTLEISKEIEYRVHSKCKIAGSGLRERERMNGMKYGVQLYRKGVLFLI